MYLCRFKFPKIKMHIGKFTYKDQTNAFGYPETTPSARFTPPIQLSNYQQIKHQHSYWRYRLAYQMPRA